MSGTSVLIVVAAGLCASALVGLCLGPRRPSASPGPGEGSASTTRPSATARGTSPARPATTATVGTAIVAAPATSTAAASGPGGGPRRGLGARMADSRLVRRSLGALTVVLVVAAGISISWPFWTDQYQSRLQVRLERQLEQQIESPEAADEFVAGRVESGDSLTRLRAPSIGVDVVVVEGTTQAALRAGAGHYPETALPCGSGNVAIAGHRTTFGQPFNRLDEMAPGAEITLETPIGTCTYRVAEAAFVVTPDDVEVVAPTDTPRLTLTTCHPKGSARERLVLHADLVGDPLLEDRGGRTPPDIRGEA